MEEVRRSPRNWGDSSNSDPESHSNDLARKKSFSRQVGCLAACVLVVMIAIIVFYRGPKPNSGTGFERPEETQIADGMSFDFVRVQQSLLKTKAGMVLVQHYPKKWEAIPEFEVMPGEIAEVHFEPDSAWHEGMAEGRFLTTFNCGTFVLGDDVGLTPDDMVDFVPRYGYPNPFRTLLDAYYRPVMKVSLDELVGNVDSFFFQKGDVFCFVKDNGESQGIIHAARLQDSQSELMFLSKMGRRGPILSTNLNFLLRHYSESNKFEVYRLRTRET